MIDPCPSAPQLSHFANSEEGSDLVRAHVSRCKSCLHEVETIRDNQRFLCRFAPALIDVIDSPRRTSAAASGRIPEQRLSHPPLPAAGIVRGFELIEEISRGGQGVVYRAVQTTTKRCAAVKMLLGGAFATERQRYRFNREIEIAAGLRHPNIVSVFESGETSDGTPYVAMEFVDGVPLDRYVEDRLGPPPEARSGKGSTRVRVDQVMRLMSMVASGVGHAHTCGVIHRDLKPSNIFVDTDGNPRVLDFGIARIAEPSFEVTATHEFVGTPAYASPEQLADDAGSVDARSDVYTLGLVLYGLLTGRHPYPRDGSIARLARHVIGTEATPLSRHLPRIPADVETIVLKCLSKNPARRYPNASALGADIDDYLAGRPISARRESTAYVLRTLALKHRVPVAAGALALTTVVSAAVGLALLARDLDRSRQSTEAALSDSTVQRARLMGAAGDIGRAESLLWGRAIQDGMLTDDTLCVRGSHEALRSAWSLAELYARVPRLFRTRVGAGLLSVGIDPAMPTVWALDRTGSRWTWSLDGRLLGRTPGLNPPLPAATVCASTDGRFMVVQSADAFTLHDLRQGTIVAGPVPWKPDYLIEGVSDDGLTLAFGEFLRDTVDQNRSDRSLRLFDVRTSRPFTAIEGRATNIRFQDSPDGLLLLAGTSTERDPRVRIHRAPDWNVIRTVPMPDSTRVKEYYGVRGPRLTPDGAYLLATIQPSIFLFDLADTTGKDPTVNSIRSPVRVSTLDELGRNFIVGATDGTVAVFSVPDLSLRLTIPNGEGATAIAIRADPSVIAACDDAGLVSVYEMSERPWLHRVPASESTTQSVDIAPDGTIAWGDDAGTLAVRAADAPNTTIKIRAHGLPISSVDFSPDGTEILTAGADGAIHLWSLSGFRFRTVASALPGVWSARFAPDGHTIAWGERGGFVGVWKDGASQDLIRLDCHARRVPMIAFSPDGRFLVSAAADGLVRVWDPETGAQVRELDAPSRTSRAVAVSPDGRFIAAGFDDRTIAIWDARSGTRLRTLEGLPWSPHDLRFEPGGCVLFAVGSGGEIVVFDPIAGTELAKLAVHERSVFSLGISTDGRRLYTSGQDPWIGITDLDRLRSYIRGNETVWKDDLARNHRTLDAGSP